MSFNHKTIEELHDLLVSKEISATELTQATLEDIKAREEAVNAFVTVAEEAALAQAKAIDEKGIDKDNLLSGIPLAVKDNISTDGILTTAASKMLYNYEPIFDATAVANAKAKDGAENLLFVSHGAALWGLIITMDLAFPEGVRFGNCNICVYDYNQGQLELLQVIDPISGLEVTL